MPGSTAQRERRTLAQSKQLGVPSARGRFLRLDDMIASTGLSESTIRRRVREGEMPKPIALTKRCVGWWESDFAAWASEHRSPRTSD
ncbi:AlpA family phage regulatory protein [Sphingomonas sp. UV9]|uniref:helix-turn-helix transcriptional regulator n=1 Tax=Sphingomonas sp. UV9 TaxID=1851410 RepID=UPI000FFC8EC7|nr:AlpA family phage regulatory protein [Sphingomonas sp. UV9]RXD05535.1 AlpA family phage regulatory protein [Sphingomonas sp. UV9]